MVRQAGLLPYTNQYIGVPKYGYDLDAARAVGHGAAARAGGHLGDRARAWSAPCASARRTDLVLLAWVVPFFLITGWFDVKFVRYLLPIYPIMILWASAWLWRVAQRSRLGRVALLDGGGRHRPLRPRLPLHLHAAAHGGDRLRVGLPPHPGRQDDPHPALGRGLPDAAAAAATRASSRSSTCPTTSPTRRRSGGRSASSSPAPTTSPSRPSGSTAPLTMAPEKYPISNNYFYLLFAGDLGYTPIYDHASRPGLFGIEFPDELADESITVYDHPKVIIFENTGHLSADDIQQKIMQGIPSRKLTRTDLLLARAGDTGVERPRRDAADPLQPPPPCSGSRWSSSSSA